MKTKKWFLSVAMFAVAIIGAFAISTTAQEDLYYRSNEASPTPCQNISVDCLDGNVQCRVDSPVGTRFVWQNSGCTTAKMHTNSDILPAN